jgi:hypothetical protein
MTFYFLGPEVIIDNMQAASFSAIILPNSDNLSCIGTPQLDCAQDEPKRCTCHALILKFLNHTATKIQTIALSNIQSLDSSESRTEKRKRCPYNI